MIGRQRTSNRPAGGGTSAAARASRVRRRILPRPLASKKRARRRETPGSERREDSSLEGEPRAEPRDAGALHLDDVVVDAGSEIDARVALEHGALVEHVED